MKINTAIITILVVAFLVIVGMVVFITYIGKDAAAFVALIGTLLSTIAGFVVIILNMKSQNAEIATVKGQTNGTLSNLLAINAAKDAQLKTALGLLTPADAQSVLETTLSKDAVTAAVNASLSTPPAPPAAVSIAPTSTLQPKSELAPNGEIYTSIATVPVVSHNDSN